MTAVSQGDSRPQSVNIWEVACETRSKRFVDSHSRCVDSLRTQSPAVHTSIHRQMATFVAAPPVHKPQPGLVGNALRKQEVSNPGLRQQLAVAEVKRQRALKEEVSKLSAQVAALEVKLAAKDAAAGSELAALVANLRALTEAALNGDAILTGPTSAGAVGAAVGQRPSSAPYRTLNDAASAVSWSADAYGKSKTPGWYHTCRKELYKQRAARAAAEPSGCFISHSKYAAEATRVAPADRPAFGPGKHPRSKPTVSTPRA